MKKYFAPYILGFRLARSYRKHCFHHFKKYVVPVMNDYYIPLERAMWIFFDKAQHGDVVYLNAFNVLELMFNDWLTRAYCRLWFWVRFH